MSSSPEQAPPVPPPPEGMLGPPSKDDCTMAMLAHLLGIFSGFLGALIIWLVKKDQSKFVDDQAKEALNFQLALLIGYVVSSVLVWCFLIGVITGLLLYVLNIVFCIIAALAANKGQAYRYPLTIRMIS